MAEIDLTNETGQKMLSWVAPIYKDSLIMKIIYQALGMEWGSVEKMIEDIKKQFTPYTATWGLIFWEDAWGLLRNEGGNINERRNRIISKMQQNSIINPAILRNAVSKITNSRVKIIANIAPYTFAVRYRISSPEQDTAAREVIDDLKPAHKSYIVYHMLNSWYEVDQFSWADIAQKNWEEIAWGEL